MFSGNRAISLVLFSATLASTHAAAVVTNPVGGIANTGVINNTGGTLITTGNTTLNGTITTVNQTDPVGLAIPSVVNNNPGGTLITTGNITPNGMITAGNLVGTLTTGNPTGPVGLASTGAINNNNTGGTLITAGNITLNGMTTTYNQTVMAATGNPTGPVGLANTGVFNNTGGAITSTGSIANITTFNNTGDIFVIANDGTVVVNRAASAATFAAWLNNNDLVTHSQLDSIGTLIRSGLNFVLFGSHHRTLLDNGLDHTGTGFWATGDFARHEPSHASASVGEFGVYNDVTPGLRLGAGAGINQARQSLPVGGSGKIDSSYLVLEGDYRPQDTNWIGSATVYLGSNRATIVRGYLSGATPNLSSGAANGSSWALRLRSDWNNSSRSEFNVSPYLAYTRAESRLNGYSETGGTLPVAFAAQKHTSDELRAGVTLLSRISEQTDLRFPMELAYRKNGGSTTTGVVTAPFSMSFSFNNAGSQQKWGRAGIELDHRLNRQTLLNAAALFASRGADSSWLGTISLKYAF